MYTRSKCVRSVMQDPFFSLCASSKHHLMYAQSVRPMLESLLYKGGIDVPTHRLSRTTLSPTAPAPPCYCAGATLPHRRDDSSLRGQVVTTLNLTRACRESFHYAGACTRTAARWPQVSRKKSSSRKCTRRSVAGGLGQLLLPSARYLRLAQRLAIEQLNSAN